MYTFSTLIREIRKEANLTQAELAQVLGVSTVLITMIETGEKDVSKNLITRLAKKMSVHPSSITPFIFMTEDTQHTTNSKLEKKLVEWGEKMQVMLIKDRSKMLRNAL
ncbi:MAG: helix-turn-helix transcriptional regulator [Parcubacteria group bacterium]